MRGLGLHHLAARYFRCRDRPYVSVGAAVYQERTLRMNNLIKTGIAGFAAWKWGGGIFGTIILFVIVYYLLGHF